MVGKMVKTDVLNQVSPRLMSGRCLCVSGGGEQTRLCSAASQIQISGGNETSNLKSGSRISQYLLQVKTVWRSHKAEFSFQAETRPAKTNEQHCVSISGAAPTVEAGAGERAAPHCEGKENQIVVSFARFLFIYKIYQIHCVVISAKPQQI